MIRLRARVLALCALCSLPFAVQAATIKVTTPLDIVEDDDELCSIREAITASVLADNLGRRSSVRTAMESAREALEKGLLDIEEDPVNVTFPRSTLLQQVDALITEANAKNEGGTEYVTPWDDTIRADLAVFMPKVQALGSPRGTIDLSITGYPTETSNPALSPGYYTYVDTDDSGAATPGAPFTVTDPRNVNLDGTPITGNAITYYEGDRAYWDGTNWRRYRNNNVEPQEDRIPTDANAIFVQAAIDLHERLEAAATSEIERLEGLSERDGCDDGTSFDIILLEKDVTYRLIKPLEMVIRLSLRGGGATTIIERCRTPLTAADCGDAAPSATPHRLLVAPDGLSTEIMNLTLRYGDADTEKGGAILAKGPVSLTGVRFEDNRATNGGAIHVAETGSLEIENTYFTGNSATAGNGGAIDVIGGSVRLTGVILGTYLEDPATPGTYVLRGNSATGNGGAINMAPTTGGSLMINGGAFVGNSAVDGSAIYMSSAIATLLVDNATFAENHATGRGTITEALPPTGIGTFAFNNLTMTGNRADAGSGGLSFSRLVPVQLFNSLLAGNQGAGARPDCDFANGVIDTDDFRRNYYSNGGAAGDACPGARYPNNVPELENFELPAGQTVIGYLVNAMDHAAGPYFVPRFPDDINNTLENRLVNRGANSQEVNRCAVKDQRGFDRSSSVDEECDIGAVEFQIGRRHDDVIEMLVNESRCVSVIADDLGDAVYVPGSLRVHSVERANINYQAVVVSRATCPNAVDIPAIYPEAILITPAPGFRGETDIVYGLDWTTQGAVPVSGSVTAIARVQTESRGGITTSKLDLLGAGSPLAWLCAAALLLWRRVRRARIAPAIAVLSCLALLSSPASANENIIYVNSGLDEPLVTTPGDGRCTLREAMETARNDRANMTGGDCLNGNEGPDVIEFAAGLTEVVLEASIVSYGNVTLRCPPPQEPTEDVPTPPAPQVCTIRRRAMEADGVTPNPRQFRLIDSRGSLVVSRITFRDGQTPDSGAALDGGAIFSNGTLSISDSYFIGNSAVSGGAIYLAGSASGLQITRSVFEGNASRAGMTIAGGNVVGMTASRAAACPLLARGGANASLVGSRLGGGGAIATTQSDGHKVAIQATSFLRNCAVAGAGAVDLNSRSAVAVANSTFNGNVSFEGPGAIDVSGARGNATLRNLTVIGNRSGIVHPQGREEWEPAGLTDQRSALQFGVVSVTMTSSIIAGNVRENDPTQPANCATLNGNVGTLFNVYGELVSDPLDGPTCDVVPNSKDRLVFADELLDATPDDNMLTDLVEVEVAHTKLWMHAIRLNSTAAGVLIDAGFNDSGSSPEDNQVDPVFTSTGKCAAIDARGASRGSGGRCDIGAFEVLGITAKDDRQSNSGRADRMVSLQPTANDIFDNIAALPQDRIKNDCTVTTVLADTPAAGDRTYRFQGPDTAFDADSNPDICIEVVVPASEAAAPAGSAGEKLFFCHAGMTATAEPRCANDIPDEGYVLMYDNRGLLRSEDEESGGTIDLTYRAYTFGQTASAAANISMGIENVPPQAIRDTVTVQAGGIARINVLDNDSDPDNSSPAGLKVNITNVGGGGCNEVYRDGDDTLELLYWDCQFGRLTVDEDGNMTWTSHNTFNPFQEEITYEISDGDPVQKKVAKSVVTFRIDRPASNGGSILGDDDLGDMLGLDFLGAPSPVFFLPLLLSLFRRRA